METQTPHPDSDKPTLDFRFAMLRADIQGEFSGLESRLVQRLIEIEHNQKMALLQSESRQQVAMQEMESRQRMAMQEMGARLQESVAVFRTQYETTVPTLATKADLLQQKAEMHSWFLKVSVGLFVAFGGAGLTLYRLAALG